MKLSKRDAEIHRLVELAVLEEMQHEQELLSASDYATLLADAQSYMLSTIMMWEMDDDAPRRTPAELVELALEQLRGTRSEPHVFAALAN